MITKELYTKIVNFMTRKEGIVYARVLGLVTKWKCLFSLTSSIGTLPTLERERERVELN